MTTTVHPGPFEEAARRLRAAGRVVVFTGAGISAESGIPTFRDDSGLWREFPPEQFANWPALVRAAFFRPARLVEFLHAVLAPIAEARPNPAHQAIAELERHLITTVITQNVDGLHQEAGSLRVREVHGSFFKVVNLRGRFLRRLGRPDLLRIVERLRRARAGPFKLLRLCRAVAPLLGLSWRGVRRPAVVLFGDALAEPDWTFARQDVQGCELMLVVGTSGAVLPAALLPVWARQQGARIIHVDPHDSGHGHLWLRGPAAEVLPRLVRAAFGPAEG
jgi:NAD-dependent deacetylase